MPLPARVPARRAAMTNASVNGTITKPASSADNPMAVCMNNVTRK